MGKAVSWKVDQHVVRTIAEDSFGGWEQAFAEAIKNSIDAGASRVVIDLPTREVMIPLDQQQVAIVDNGRGMSLEQIENDYCRTGRPKQKGTATFGRRGTGKIATFVVAQRVALASWRDHKRHELRFSTADILNAAGDTAPSTGIDAFDHSENGSGTRVVLEGFRQDAPPPSVQQLHQVLLRHFHHLSGIEFIVNGERFSPDKHASVLKEIKSTFIDGLGEFSGEILLAKHKLDRAGVVVYSEGQAVVGPALIGLEAKTYKGETGKIVGRILGRIDLKPSDPALLHSGGWTLTKAYKLLEREIGGLLENAIDQQVNDHVTERVDRWLEDPTTRRYFSKLADSEKAIAKRILRDRAKKSGTDQTAEKIIARLVVRSLSVDALSVVLDILDLSSDDDIESFSELFKGADKWNLRQVARAASLVKLHLKALDELEQCVSDYSNNENAIHQILAENAWIIADDFHSFRSNKQIKTTLKNLFDIDTDDPQCVRRPDFFFVLGDAASTSLDESSKYLLVELKGPDQPLRSAHQGQVVRDAKTIQKARPGFAYAVLLGVDFAVDDRPDEFAEAPGSYQFRAMTFQRLIERARFRLLYMLEGVKATGAEDLARKVVERQVDELVSIDGKGTRRTRRALEPFNRIPTDDVRPFENAVPLYDLRVSAGEFSPAQLVDEVPSEGTFDLDEVTWVEPLGKTKPARGLFVAQVVGESMNRRVANGSFCLFRVGPTASPDGKVVIAQHRAINDPDLGGHYTIKVLERQSAVGTTGEMTFSRVLLKPDSTDATIMPIAIEQAADGEFSIVAELVEVLAIPASGQQRR